MLYWSKDMHNNKHNINKHNINIIIIIMTLIICTIPIKHNQKCINLNERHSFYRKRMTRNLQTITNIIYKTNIKYIDDNKFKYKIYVYTWLCNQLKTIYVCKYIHYLIIAELNKIQYDINVYYINWYICRLYFITYISPICKWSHTQICLSAE